MGTFNVSLKTLTDRVSMEVVYTPKELDQICVEIAEVNKYLSEFVRTTGKVLPELREGK